jgi:hypothetical protein
MADFDVTDAAFAGFGVLRRHPLAAVAWAALSAGFIAVVLALFGGVLVSAITGMAAVIGQAAQAREAGQAGAGMAARQLPVIMSAIGSLFGVVLVVWLGAIVISAVVTAAVFRAVLEPEKSAYAYLRLGTTELWLMLQAFVQALLLGIAQMLMSIPITVISLLAMGSSMAGQSPNPVVLMVTLIGRLAVYGISIWLYLRLSMAAPMTFADRRFRLFESWALTRGQDFRLLGVGVLVFVVVVAIYMLLMVVLVAGGFASLAGLFAGAQLKPEYQHLSTEGWIGLLTPLVGLALGLFAVGALLLMPITLAPWARVYQRLSPKENVDAVFA